jgi:hypothetical protein
MAAAVLAIWAAAAVAAICLAAAVPGQGAGSASGSVAVPPSSSSPAVRRAEASFEERRNSRGGWDRRVVEPRYSVVRAQRTPRNAEDVLLAQLLVSTSHSDAEATESQLTVTAWASARGRFDEKIWTISDAADDGAVRDEHELFMTTKHGCCGAEDVHGWYSLRTGKLEATSTAEGVAFVAIPNTATERIVAVHGYNGQRPPQLRRPIPNLLAVLTLGSQDGPVHRLAITAAGVEAWTPQVRLQAAGKKEESASLDLWPADKNPAPSGISAFRIHLTFEGGGVVSIPVERDDFDLAHAAVPPPFHLERVDG